VHHALGADLARHVLEGGHGPGVIAARDRERHVGVSVAIAIQVDFTSSSLRKAEKHIHRFVGRPALQKDLLVQQVTTADSMRHPAYV
jgi:hypothetical protein